MDLCLHSIAVGTPPRFDGSAEWYRANEAWWRPIEEGELRAYYERTYGTRKVLKEVRG